MVVGLSFLCGSTRQEILAWVSTVDLSKRAVELGGGCGLALVGVGMGMHGIHIPSPLFSYSLSQKWAMRYSLPGSTVRYKSKWGKWQWAVAADWDALRKGPGN